jgi:hypothetical protein
MVEHSSVTDSMNSHKSVRSIRVIEILAGSFGGKFWRKVFGAKNGKLSVESWTRLDESEA